MKAILNNWSVMRGLRLLIGLIALGQSVIQKDITFAIIAGFLFLTAMANIGGCGGNVCEVNFRNGKKEKGNAYEELDNN